MFGSWGLGRRFRDARSRGSRLDQQLAGSRRATSLSAAICSRDRAEAQRRRRRLTLSDSSKHHHKEPKMPDDRQDASDFTRAVNEELLSMLPFEDRQDFEDAARGHIADVSGSVVHTPDGRVTWDPNKFAFLGEDKPCPPTVNPSLWRQSQLCAKGGLFKVVDRIVPGAQPRHLQPHHRRGRHRSDPLRSADLHRVRAGGAAICTSSIGRASRSSPSSIRTATSTTTAASRVSSLRRTWRRARSEVIAPEGFLEAAVSENIMAGNVMTRRALYQYGVARPVR